MELRVENLCKAFEGRPVLRNISFRIGPGITCLMAPSGAGKTTLLRILLGLEQADSGTVSVPVRMAAVFQEDRLLNHLSARGNLHFALGHVGAEADALLKELGLADEGKKPVAEYSGGMRRRVALARALLSASDALVLDEPFTGLDEENRLRCIACIRRYTEGKPVLLVTHDPEDAAALDAPVVNL